MAQAPSSAGSEVGGMAHSTFRLFKQFQRKGKQPSSGITLEEFRAEAEALNFNLDPTELEALFADLGGEYEGGISLQMLYQVLGAVGTVILGRQGMHEVAIFHRERGLGGRASAQFCALSRRHDGQRKSCGGGELEHNLVCV